MNKKLSVIVGTMLIIPALSQAAENRKPLTKWTCEDFLAIDAKFQPTVVGFAEALNKNDKPEDAVLDVKGVETVTPALVQACMMDKKALFKKKADSEWDKIKKNL
ncbi:acid-activated periplasmic chaperone HdeA [Yokenella regensburgei]|uniref:acid-activated periplasmic chaperone HdeA n=1 Tax=Yokenella regensburgei TaxID=158877 RepID=UPI0027D96D8A|nr:acid-activated periplasmic chaperone HdeA [Yokenella regensburgei]MDQ4429043.1 acid-activated periplasmic chaperone HdeA [Yokenella regensburgei]